MAIITSKADLNQGSSAAVTDMVFAAGTTGDIKITGTLPAWADGEFFEVRDHSNSQNNGLYQVETVTTTTSDYECDKVNGLAPVTASSEAVTTLGATGTSTEKSVFVDTAGLGVYLLEQGNLSVDGVTGQALYSFFMQEWKDDSFLIANAPFPMLTIDSDAGKYIIGQDPNGNDSGFIWVDDWATFAIRTRKLLRNAGWDEVDADGNTVARWVGTVTLGDFEDNTNDNAYYQFGDDTTVDDTVDFDFAGPVNEAVQFFEEIGNPATFTYVDGGGTEDSVTRASGSFIDDGFKVGGQMTTRASTTSLNDGTYEILTVAALTMEFATASFDTAEADTAAQVSVNNSNAMTLRLRVRDGDTYGKTFAQANLASAGKTILGNFVYSFPLANSPDLKIEATDLEIDANSDGTPDVSPYSGMHITYHSTGQSRSGLVGGDKDFGIIIEANDGTSQEVYEFVQWSLRSTGGFGSGDIDNDTDVAIGRAMDGLMRFVGETLEVGSTDGGLSFPINPDGGGTGVFIDSLNAASKNDVKFWDNTQPGTPIKFPETIAVTLDFNATLISDTAAEYDLFYDRTIRTPQSSLTDFVLSNATSNITSAGGNLPTNSEISLGKYIRIGGLTGTDAAMNGVYQITVINTAAEDWEVVRYDGQAIVDVTTTAADLDQNCIDTPDSILVFTDVTATGTADIGFTNPNTISSTGPDLSIFTTGMFITITGTASNNLARNFALEVSSSNATTITLVDSAYDVTTEAGTSAVITEVVSGLADIDETFSYDFDGNTQGGRTVSTTTYVKAKAVGFDTAQYTESTVQSIETGTPLTIPLVSQTERNTV